MIVISMSLPAIWLLSVCLYLPYDYQYFSTCHKIIRCFYLPYDCYQCPYLPHNYQYVSTFHMTFISMSTSHMIVISMPLPAIWLSACLYPHYDYQHIYLLYDYQYVSAWHMIVASMSLPAKWLSECLYLPCDYQSVSICHTIVVSMSPPAIWLLSVCLYLLRSELSTRPFHLLECPQKSTALIMYLPP